MAVTNNFLWCRGKSCAKNSLYVRTLRILNLFKHFLPKVRAWPPWLHAGYGPDCNHSH